VSLSRTDWLYADLYLERAEQILKEVCPRETFEGLARERDRIPQLAADLRAAVERAHWAKAKELAQSGERIRREVEHQSQLLDLGTRVYGRRVAALDTTMLVLAGVVAERVESLFACSGLEA